jgi:hypothetical protein
MLPTIQINDVSLDQLTYQDVPVVTFQQIADVHGILLDNVYKSFKRHKPRFTEGKHFYIVDNKGVDLESNVSFSTSYLFTEKGYLLLTKPMRDQKSWEVQERMIDDYFTLKTVLSGHDDLAAIQQTLIKVAAIRDAQRRIEIQQQAILVAQREQDQRMIEQSHRISEATALAQQAFLAQMTMTLRYYRYIEKLDHQLPDAELKAFGRYLTQYCLENVIPVGKEPVADRQWGAEHRYPVAVIQEQLPGWLARYHGQGSLPPGLADA